jgi:Asp-tRNA(Asn)/Glu-tRNA(Gln) amidotransferase A subunit family amidase
VRGWHYVRAREVQRRATAAVVKLFERHDVLAMPTVPITAPTIGARTWHLGETEVDVRAALLSLTSGWGVVGLPALSVPAGTVGGLPVGLQLIGPPRGEELLFRTAEQLG